jgi:hypothetical protein
MKMYGAVDALVHVFLISAVVGVEWSASRPGRFTPGERAPGTQWIEGWVGPRTGPNDAEKAIFFTLPGLELRPLSSPGRGSSYNDCAIVAPIQYVLVYVLWIWVPIHLCAHKKN